MSKRKADASEAIATAGGGVDLLEPVSPYAVIAQSAQSAMSALRENLDGEQIGMGDLDRIRIPTGGITTWTIPSIAGDQDAKDFEGIIISVGRRRSFWRGEYNGEGTPPDCRSDDGEIGVGDPGVVCDSCPFNQWGSHPKSENAKACKEQRLVFLLRPGDYLPVVLSLPPSSINVLKKYLVRLAGQGIPYYGVVTRFTLEPDKSGTGIKFAKAAFATAQILTSEEVDKTKAFAEMIRPALDSVRDDQAAREAAVN